MIKFLELKFDFSENYDRLSIARWIAFIVKKNVYFSITYLILPLRFFRTKLFFLLCVSSYNHMSA